MKKVVTMMIAILMLITAPGVSVFAEEAKTVWIDSQKAVLADGKLKVSVSTDGTVTDGLLVLSYDSKVLSITEESAVEVADAVGMYAVNLVEDEVRISYVAENAIEKGDFLTVTFSTQCKDTQSAVKGLEELTGEGYTKEKSFDEASVGIIRSTVVTPGTNQKEDPKKEDKTQTKNPASGDSANLVLPVVCLAVAAAGVVLCISMKRKGGKNNEI